MEKETKTNIIISGLLIIANAIGIAYFLDPEKFKAKVKDMKDATKEAFGSKK